MTVNIACGLCTCCWGQDRSNQMIMACENKIHRVKTLYGIVCIQFIHSHDLSIYLSMHATFAHKFRRQVHRRHANSLLRKYQHPSGLRSFAVPVSAHISNEASQKHVSACCTKMFVGMEHLHFGFLVNTESCQEMEFKREGTVLTLPV